jgi:hypothetical protein
MAQTTQQQPIVIEAIAQTPEAVAYQLMLLVAGVEGIDLTPVSGGGAAYSPARTKTKATKQWILETYAECLKTTKGP